MSGTRAVILALGLMVPMLCSAQQAVFKTPSLANMQHEAVESTNITIGPVLLWFARRFTDKHDPHSAATKNLLRGLHKVQVHSYRYDTDHVYEPADLEKLRSQLATPGWHRMVQVRDRGPEGDVDIYYTQDDRIITGLVVVAAAPREFTLVNISGRIDMKDIDALSDTFVPHAHAESQDASRSPNPDEQASTDSGDGNQLTKEVELDRAQY